MAQKLVMTRLGVISCAKIFGVMYFIIGLLIALPMGAISAITDGIAQGIAMMFGLPIFYAALGVIGGLIMVIPYNIIAPKIGGIEYEAEVILE